MQTYKLTDETLTQACRDLKEANQSMSEAKKKGDNAKAVIEARLESLRGLKLSSLVIGDLVSIDKVLLIEIGKQNRFDEASFQVAHPLLYAEFKRDCPTKKFKPLV